jgi:hypothetical protein
MKGRSLAGLVGLILGVAIGLGAAAIYNRKSAALFANRVHCRTIAEGYITKSVSSPMLDKVDFSPARNSCVAAMQSHYLGFWNYEVADVVSNETLFTESCNYDAGKCGGGVDMKFLKEREEAFNKALGR